MLSFNNISKSYGARTLFDNVTFTLNPRERVGLVGRNGHGKTTLLNITAGFESPDSGGIIMPKDYKIGYLTQKISFLESTVLKEASAGLSEERKDDRYIAERILFGLGFLKEDMEKSPMSLSGGFQVRLNLAKLLVSESNLLIMDEPTNYLDILSIRWLESFLTGWRGEILFVTHDRTFMDRVATHIAGIHRQKVRKIQGDTSKYYSQIAQDEEIYEKTRVNDEAKRREMELYITRFRAKARLAGMVQSRIKTLAKMEKKEKLSALSELDFNFQYKDIVSNTVFHAENLSFAYNGEPLFKNLSFTLDKGDRLCIIGQNGAGKSTLLKIIAGSLEPASGRMVKHAGAQWGYFEQTNISSLRGGATIEEEVSSACDYKLDRTKVRSICAAMLFSGDDALKRIDILSGGEKCRVMLAKILASPVTCLLLDEPTNHLDMDASDSLMDAISDFEGPVAMVTHNETYLHALANKLIVFKNGDAFLFEGGYAEFLEKVGWESEEEKDRKPVQSKVNKKDLRKQKADLLAQKNAEIKPLNAKIEELENLIFESEEELERIYKDIETATSEGNGLLLNELGINVSRLNSLIDELLESLNDVTVRRDKLSKRYEDKLEELESI